MKNLYLRETLGGLNYIYRIKYSDTIVFNAQMDYTTLDESYRWTMHFERGHTSETISYVEIVFFFFWSNKENFINQQTEVIMIKENRKKCITTNDLHPNLVGT